MNTGKGTFIPQTWTPPELDTDEIRKRLETLKTPGYSLPSIPWQYPDDLKQVRDRYRVITNIVGSSAGLLAHRNGLHVGSICRRADLRLIFDCNLAPWRYSPDRPQYVERRELTDAEAYKITREVLIKRYEKELEERANQARFREEQVSKADRIRQLAEAYAADNNLDLSEVKVEVLGTESGEAVAVRIVASGKRPATRSIDH